MIDSAGTTTIARLHFDLLQWARRRLPRATDAEDAVQETWLAHRKFEGRSSLRHYLFSVLRRRVADYYRRAERDLAAPMFESWSALERLPDTTTSAGTRLNRHKRLLRLREALGYVGEPYQTALRLEFEGLEPKAIARRLGVPAPTVRSRLIRGRRQLAKLLLEED